MIEIFRKISYYFKPSIIKKTRPYLVPISLGVLLKLNTIALFIIPIAGIKSVSEGRFSNRISSVFDALYLPKPSDENLFIFFLTIILFTLASLFVLYDLKYFSSWKIKKKFYIRSKVNENLSRKEYYQLKRKFRGIDKIIKNTENLSFCLILVILIISYDIQIALITLFGGFAYYKLIKYRNYKRNLDFKNLPPIEKNEKYDRKMDFLLNNGKGRRKLTPLISTLVMLSIMILISLRTNPAISIIFIFLVRIYQNNMLKSIYSYLKKKDKR